MKVYLIVVGILSNSIGFAQAGGWSGRGEVGIVSACGNTNSRSINLGLGIDMISKVFEHKLKLSALNVRSDNQTSAESYIVDYQVTENSFLFGCLGYL